ncbi:hypothetical protein Scep_025366 [Stephania cephalantha]|uniref:Uncharacterized protein n=1 Tax=Stephania cephalantha TaxID=152367 RepID=A0AAP0HR57_9MAGN
MEKTMYLCIATILISYVIFSTMPQGIVSLGDLNDYEECKWSDVHCEDYTHECPDCSDDPEYPEPKCLQRYYRCACCKD